MRVGSKDFEFKYKKATQLVNKIRQMKEQFYNQNNHPADYVVVNEEELKLLNEFAVSTSLDVETNTWKTTVLGLNIILEGDNN